MGKTGVSKCRRSQIYTVATCGKQDALKKTLGTHFFSG